MIIIRLRSGLGNQMFQYAFFKQMQYWYGSENVKLDIDTYHWRVHNGLEIDKVFDIDLRKDSISPKISLKLADVGYGLKHRLLRRLRGIKHKSYSFWKDLKYEDYKNFAGDIYLEGYWNEEKYFKDVVNQIKTIYTFKPGYEDTNLLNKLSEGTSVGLHVRRGDYIKYKSSFPMCSKEYYQEAIEIIKSKINSELTVFVFSDDIQWCKDNLDFVKNVTFVENNIAYKDMMLMSFCKHNVIANSTFSWWAAWLNNNKNKLIIYPSSASITYATMPKNWIKL